MLYMIIHVCILARKDHCMLFMFVLLPLGAKFVYQPCFSKMVTNRLIFKIQNTSIRVCILANKDHCMLFLFVLLPFGAKFVYQPCFSKMVTNCLIFKIQNTSIPTNFHMLSVFAKIFLLYIYLL